MAGAKSVSERISPTKNVKEVEDESHLDFIAGFPCTNYRCQGRLSKDGYGGHTAIRCSICEHVYYVLADS